MWTLLKDLRYAIRVLRANPGFTAVAVTLLALGIGANTAIFQLLDAIRLRTIPVKDPQRLTLIDLADHKGWRGSQASAYATFTNPMWERFRDTQDAFSGVLAWGQSDFNLSPGGEVHLAHGMFVSGDFFQVLGVPPLMGRFFTAADDRRGCAVSGAVVSYSFWQRELGGDAGAVGRKITIDYHPVEVIGIAPASFFGLEIGHSFDIAVPICAQPALRSRSWLDWGTAWWLSVLGRLKPGGTIEEANTRLLAGSAGLFRATLPTNYPAVNVKDYLRFKLHATPAGNGVSSIREQYGDPLLLLLGTAGLVLLIACANLANLMLARATAREREIAVRLAIGASRGRLIRQLMAESLLIAIAGAGLGWLLASTLSDGLVALLGTEGNPLFLDLAPDPRVLAFTIGLASLTCVLFGLAPAFRATSIAPGEAIKSGSRSTGGRERFGLRQALVVSQVALSVVLVTGALLFSGSLRKLMAVDAGFQHTGILVTNLDFSRLKIPIARRSAFRNELQERIRSLPGVDSAAQVDVLPLSGSSTTNLIWMDGRDSSHSIAANFSWIGAGYLKTMGIPLLTGRDFDNRDTPDSTQVAIVTQTFARSLGLGDNPVGQRFRRQATPSSPETVFEIAGVVKDTKYYELREKFRPIAFLATTQDSQPNDFPRYVVRSAAPLSDVTGRIRTAMAEVNPAIGIDFRSYEGIVQEGLLRERLMATLSSFFGLLAALIAAIGLYGVLSYLVVRRTNEIGIRMALGADRNNILALVLREAGTLLAIGLGVGLALSVAGGHAVRSMLFGLSPYDSGTLATAVVLLVAVALAASYLPARRAARLEPMAALREE